MRQWLCWQICLLKAVFLAVEGKSLVGDVDASLSKVESDDLFHYPIISKGGKAGKNGQCSSALSVEYNKSINATVCPPNPKGDLLHLLQPAAGRHRGLLCREEILRPAQTDLVAPVPQHQEGREEPKTRHQTRQLPGRRGQGAWSSAWAGQVQQE
jgi:hypothetical protein